MIQGLELAKNLEAEVIEAKCDSLLVVNQVNGTFEAREERMQRYLDKLHVSLHRFNEWTLQHVPRDQNSEADALTNLGSSVEEDELKIGEVVQLMRSVVEEGHAEINSTSLTWDWRNTYVEYIRTGKLPSDPKESRALHTKAARFSLSKDGTLVRRMFDGPMAICLGPGDTEYILREIHKSTCGNHSGAESLVQKIIRVGYYWINMERDAKEYTKLYLLRSKDDAVNTFISYKIEVENQLSRKIKRIRFDRGGEYLSLNEFCKKNEIIHEVTPSYSPESNGVPERKNRTLKEMMNSMLVSSNAPDNLWGEAK
ncbi:uncharacterized protein [Nicotiana tomentosiformis]|uniref:uncharacterized protein n=1 Tax=Nicotiana tomentosiformis TaxID=4098 RepID=UPI00388C79E0